MSSGSVADPGFPIGGVDLLGGHVDPLGGSVDPRCGHFSPKMCAKMKELGPVGGECTRHAPRSANEVLK